MRVPWVSWRCPVCGMDTSDPDHRAWACEAALAARERPTPEVDRPRDSLGQSPPSEPEDR